MLKWDKDCVFSSMQLSKRDNRKTQMGKLHKNCIFGHLLKGEVEKQG